MGVESLGLKASFRQKFPYWKQRLWQISLLLNPGNFLLGYLTATDLEILRVDPMGTLRTGDCNTVDNTGFVGELKVSYPSVFQEIGKLKDYQLKLHVDPSVTPVVQKMRRVPFSVKLLPRLMNSLKST